MKNGQLIGSNILYFLTSKIIQKIDKIIVNIIVVHQHHHIGGPKGTLFGNPKPAAGFFESIIDIIFDK